MNLTRIGPPILEGYSRRVGLDIRDMMYNDAVYIGGKEFSLRTRSGNFDNSELEKVSQEIF